MPEVADRPDPTAAAVEHMRSTASGWRCAVCFLDGKIIQTRKDGTPLSEEDRCPGCGETVCDRDHYLAGSLDKRLRHSVHTHALAVSW